MITDADVKKLQQVFPTKSDLDAKLKPIHQKIDKMDKKLDTTIKFFDTITNKHHKRIRRIEEHLELPPFPDFA